MAGTKRKAESAATPTKKPKSASSNEKPAKRARKSETATEESSGKSQNAAPKSVFNDEEKSFPRGGASVLTPLEHKQIQIQATQDVLFEQAGLKRTGEDGLNDGASDAGEQDAPKAGKKRKSKKSKKSHEADEVEDEAIRVEGLSLQKLIPGTLVLGQVTEVTPRSIVLSLPNNLIGFVALTAISDQLTARIEKLVEEQESGSADGSDSEDYEDVNPKDMFHVGQYLRACVTSTEENSIGGGAAKKKIELSINPSLVNRGITKSSIIVNSTIQASVVSNEDHGLVMEMGLDEPQLKGFLPKSEVGHNLKHADIQEGSVLMCFVSRLNPDGRIVTLSADYQKAGNVKKLPYITEAPTIDVFVPGTAVDLLVADVTSTTVTGKIMGLIDATADAVHSGAANNAADLNEKYKIGSRVKARIICTFPGADPKKVGVSLLDHVVSLSRRMSGKPKEKKDPLVLLPISSFIEEAKVIRVESRAGLYLDLGVRDVVGFAHISRLADGQVDLPTSESGPFKVDSTHRCRIIGYNPMDGLFQVSLQQKVLDQPFLRLQDIRIGQIAKGKVRRLIVNKKGNTSVLVDLSEGITGVVPEMHMADIRLQHPDRKFREGASVTARVLSVDIEKHSVQLTLKKSLVNSDKEPWTDFASVPVGAEGHGTLVDVKISGAVVKFYGDATAWLPAAEMSETYIEDATRHFQKGQVVNVRVILIDQDANRVLVSCKDPNAVDSDKEALFQSLNVGDIARGTILEKGVDSATVDLGHGVRGVLRVGQLTDGSEKKDRSTMARIRVGGPLEDIVVLDKHNKTRTVTLSNKPSLRKAAQAKKLVTQFSDIKSGATIHGFVRAILPEKVFVEFGGGVVGLLFKSQLPDDIKDTANFGLRQDQSITARVNHGDPSQSRFWLSMIPEADASPTNSRMQETSGEATVNAVDSVVKTTTDLSFGTTTIVQIKSVKSTQMNVLVADNVQGRIHVAEIFNNWEEIQNPKRPLRPFKIDEKVPVKVIGMHDARNNRFLPITHRQGRTPIFEMTLKKDADILSLHSITEGSPYIAFVNNITDRYVWANLSANIRGRIDYFDLTDDLSLLEDVEGNFPIGSALRVRVKVIDPATGRLDLTAASSLSAKALDLKDLQAGLVLPARVTKVLDSHIVVQINENIAGPIHIEQLADDYDKAQASNFKVGEIIRVCVLDTDVPNKKITLSTRPSKVLSSSLPVRDPEFQSISQLKVHQVVRGFVQKVTDKGIFVRLGPRIQAFVKISHLSDSYIKDWKSGFQVDQLVTGKVIAADPKLKNPQLSLKKSVVEGTYVKPLELKDFKVGQIVTAKIRQVQEYGVFLVVDGSKNVSGLCHKSQMADSKVEDVKALYKEGDAVKAKILMVNRKKRIINFGLKYSQIKGEESDEEEDDDTDEKDAIAGADESEISEMDVGDEDADMRSVKSDESNEDDVSLLHKAEDDKDGEDDEDEDTEAPAKSNVVGLSTPGFDWTGTALDFDDYKAAADSSSDEDTTKKKKKHKKATIKEDRTGDLDAHGPQSVADYERLLLGQPNSAELWVRYMVFQRELNEIEKARQIARRALATMNPREEKARLDVWTALLHLENDFSSDDLIEDTFKEACQYNDAREMHERMIKIYISSGKLDKADTLYTTMTKTKVFTPDPLLWLSYATFLLSTLSPPSPSRAHALLPRAVQSVPAEQHRYLTSKFAALEYKSPNGDPERGRTIFEGLVDLYPKRGDLWDMYLSLEMGHGGEEQVRGLFERMSKAAKRKRGEKMFARWRAWEEGLGNGGGKGVDRVLALEQEWREKKVGKGVGRSSIDLG
ncbi:rRNA biogenesis protein-like protein RRP5 [Lophiostoma macrostomum CBS 122681]|uniref:rRNA biogenesis protein RRP5 n=1 Tax=Lophiostoma macrostomum CBS 122681 TaxID=1314788 RepID=A0A6A6TIV9_9PLEO|nr:rRNA biogenesis protein-like protein RRP5 [Lophiostoma macrostomum CBS 122681]